MKCAGQALYALGPGGLSHSDTIVQKCIALGMKYHWTEPAMQIFWFWLPVRVVFSEQVVENFLSEIMEVYNVIHETNYYVSAILSLIEDCFKCFH